MIDWIVEHEAFFFGMMVGSFIVLVVWSFMLSWLHAELKKLARMELQQEQDDECVSKEVG